MSSLRNANKSVGRVHRERSQPSNRRHLGELEKKRDYKKRAAAYSQNQNAIRKLRRKALERNPDEFYFHMVNSKIEDGMHREKPKEKDEDTEVQALIMQSQDEKILDEFSAIFAGCEKNFQTKELKKAGSNDEPAENEADGASGKALTSFLTSVDVKRLSAKLPCPLSRSKLAIAISGLHPDKIALFRELLSRLHVENELRIVAEKIRMRKLVAESAKKGIKPKRVKSGNEERPPVYRWKYERKR
ncbi:Utp11 protein [Trichuris suis]|nr:Utp11 protein [Trichuris suis]